jgi:CRISPR-associated protein Csm1
MDQDYLRLLLAGLATPYSEEFKSESLNAITGEVWGAHYEKKLAAGKLNLNGNFLPGHAAEDRDWDQESDFVSQLFQRHNSAGKYSYFFLASAWASRRAVPGMPSITLFDENRVTAARAICDQTGDGTYLYFKGAISGIQKYIYNNIKAEQTGDAERVGKRLRGRSFLVALLGDLLADYLVDQLQLASANVLFVGGGHFNLLLPNTAALKKKLDEIIWQVNDKLLDQFDLQLSIYGGSTTVEAKDFDQFGPKFIAVHDELERAKQQRFSKHLSDVFFQKTREARYGKTEEEQQLESLGSKIPRAKYLLQLQGDVSDRAAMRKALGLKARFTIAALSTDILLLSEEDIWPGLLAALKEAYREEGVQIKLFALNSTDFLPPASLQKDYLAYPISYGFRMIGQYAPDYEAYKFDNSNTGLVELSDLATLNTNGQPKLEYKQLGALRLDIDDLGALFAQGLGKPASLTKTMALSREVQLFFGGYFNKIAEQHHTYVVYAGGDDAFVLGSWVNILGFIRHLREVFQVFTTGNPEIGFSAGIYLSNPKYPIARLANNAGEEEGKAKKDKILIHQEEGEAIKGQKNAVRIFGHTIHWERFEKMMIFAEKLYESMEERGGGIKRSVLQVLLRVIQAAHAAKEAAPAGAGVEEREDSAHFEFYRNIGRLHGLLSRRGYIGHELMEELLHDMSDFDRFQDYLLPIHYVLYKTRRS